MGVVDPDGGEIAGFLKGGAERVRFFLGLLAGPLEECLEVRTVLIGFVELGQEIGVALGNRNRGRVKGLLRSDRGKRRSDDVFDHREGFPDRKAPAPEETDGREEGKQSTPDGEDVDAGFPRMLVGPESLGIRVGWSRCFGIETKSSITGSKSFHEPQLNR